MTERTPGDPEFIAQLEALKEEAYALGDNPPLREDFSRWQRTTIAAVSRACGSQSEEVQFFRNLRFRVGRIRRFANNTSKLIEDRLDVSFINRKVDHDYYRAAMAEAAERLLTIILSLRRNIG